VSKWQHEFECPVFGQAGQIGDSAQAYELIEVEDGGAAVIVHVEKDGRDDGMFVRLQSYNMAATTSRPKRTPKHMEKHHPEIASFLGKRVRVTVEVID
jgi:hypothetical protein